MAITALPDILTACKDGAGFGGSGAPAAFATVGDTVPVALPFFAPGELEPANGAHFTR